MFYRHLSTVYTNMVTSIVKTILTTRSYNPFWCEAPAPLEIILFCLFNRSSIHSDLLNTPLSVCYTLIDTPWIWASLWNVSLDLTVSVAFIYNWCFILLKPLEWSKKPPDIILDWAYLPPHLVEPTLIPHYVMV